jgi:hypothetical protein
VGWGGYEQTLPCNYQDSGTPNFWERNVSFPENEDSLKLVSRQTRQRHLRDITLHFAIFEFQHQKADTEK